MKITVRVAVDTGDDTMEPVETEVLALSRDELAPDTLGLHLRGRGGSVQRLALRAARRAAGLIVADANRRLCVGRRSFADN